MSYWNKLKNYISFIIKIVSINTTEKFNSLITKI